MKLCLIAKWTIVKSSDDWNNNRISVLFWHEFSAIKTWLGRQNWRVLWIRLFDCHQQINHSFHFANCLRMFERLGNMPFVMFTQNFFLYLSLFIICDLSRKWKYPTHQSNTKTISPILLLTCAIDRWKDELSFYFASQFIDWNLIIVSKNAWPQFWLQTNSTDGPNQQHHFFIYKWRLNFITFRII